MERLTVTVSGKAIQLWRGATVRHAIIQYAPDGSWLKRIQAGEAEVFDETVKAATDLGGALYPGQQLSIQLKK